MTQEFEIPYRLPGLNEVVAQNRKNSYAGARLKRETDALICACIRAARLRPIDGPCIVMMVFTEPNRRRDVDNVESAKKFILDALVKSGVIAGDSPRHVVAAPSYTVYEPAARVRVRILSGESAEGLKRRVMDAQRAMMGK